MNMNWEVMEAFADEDADGILISAQMIEQGLIENQWYPVSDGQE